MSPSERRLWEAVSRRTRQLSPALIEAILLSFQRLRDSVSDADIARAIAHGFGEQLAAQIISDAVWNVATAPVRDQLRRGVLRSVTYFQQNLPLPPTTVRSLGFSFDYLSPHVVPAIRALETKVLTALKEDTRAAVRAVVERGLSDGLASRTMAKEIRSMIGLGPTQAQEVENYRDALLGANGRRITDYNLRNRTADRLLAKGPLTPAQVERYTEAYRKARIANNASTVARTAAVDAQKAAQRLAWADAIERGIVDGDRLKHKWIGVNDDRERDAHRAMNNQVQPFNQPYSNGQMVPGDGDYGCRCLDRFFIA